jgi:hypothetical protein
MEHQSCFYLVKGQSRGSGDLRRRAFSEVRRILVEQEPVNRLVNPDFLSAAAPSVRGIRSTALFPQASASAESISLQ